MRVNELRRVWNGGGSGRRERKVEERKNSVWVLGDEREG